MKFLWKLKDYLKFTNDRWQSLSYFYLLEIRTNHAQKMADEPSYELAAWKNVIGCQPKSCSQFVGEKWCAQFNG